MKRFWIGYAVGDPKPGINKMDLYEDPHETYQEAADRAENILKNRRGRLYILELVSYVQMAEYKWTHLDE